MYCMYAEYFPLCLKFLHNYHPPIVTNFSIDQHILEQWTLILTHFNLPFRLSKKLSTEEK